MFTIRYLFSIGIQSLKNATFRLKMSTFDETRQFSMLLRGGLHMSFFVKLKFVKLKFAFFCRVTRSETTRKVEFFEVEFASCLQNRADSADSTNRVRTFSLII